MNLIIATNNKNKAQEIRMILGGYFPVTKTIGEAGIALEVVEDGVSFCENAIKKAEETLAAAEDFEAALADDSGLAVDALGGAPGIYSARYASSGHDDSANNEKLVREMAGVSNRACRFVCAVALARRGKPTLCVEGACEGELLAEHAGEGGFGYDPLFYYKPAKCSFAQMTKEQKNKISHRRAALELLKARLVLEEQE